MRKEVIFLAVAASCMLAACAKEIKEQEAVSLVSESVPEEETVVTPPVHREGWTYIGAENGEVTKASIGNSGGTAVFSWNTGDRIAVFSGDTYHVSAPMDASYDGTNAAEFAFEGSIGTGRQYYAVYPASLIDDCDNPTESSIEVKLPSSYNINQVKDDAVPIPMIAVNAPGQGLSFKRICGLLRITLANVPKPTESISLSFSGRKVNGTFTLSDVDLTVLESFKGAISVPATEAADSVITITGISLNALTKDYVINVPVPVGVTSDAEYKEVTVTTRDHEGHKINSFRAPIKSSGVWVPKRTTNRSLAVTLPVFTTQGNIGFNNGVKVVFAPGNLQATVAEKASNNKAKDGGQAVLAKVDTTSFRFATHQYDYLGATTGNKLTSKDVAVDLFNWTGATADPVSDPDASGYLGMTKDQYGMLYPSLNNAGKPFFYAANDSEHPGPTTTKALSNWYYYTGDWDGSGTIELLKKDWGEWAISDGPGVSYPRGTWRTPNRGEYISSSKTWVSEWSRLSASRKNPDLDNAIIDYLMAKATLMNGDAWVAWGVIIFPDSFTPPLGFPTINNHSYGTISSSHYAENVFSLDQWEQLEAVGCVFLPANNLRQSNSGIKIYNDGDCTYWANFAIKGSAPKASCFFACDGDLVGQIEYDSYDTGQKVHSYNTTSKKVDGVTVYTTNSFLGDKSMGRQYGCGVRLIRDVN